MKGFGFFIIIMIVLPVIMLFSNHNVFFIIVGMVMLVLSLKNTYYILSGKTAREIEQEILAGIDGNDGNDGNRNGNDDNSSSLLPESEIKRLNTIAAIAGNLIIVLFFIYCSVYINSIILRIFAALLILYRVHLILGLRLFNQVTLTNSNEGVIESDEKSEQRVFLYTVANISTIVFLVLITFNKFFGMPF
ncbi:MAG: hypothetical protein Q7J78_03020 [Clostridiales bacterium]|nr:hypothetical protein [Clostridiales bacterium]